MSVCREKEKVLKILACDFRKAIDEAKENNEPEIFFRKFPNGQCGHTSDILAQYFIDNNIGPITYVNGTYYSDINDDPDDRQAHTWLIVDGLVIDITGDQFRNRKKPLKYDVPVYVGPMTEYYKLFEVGPGGSCEHLGLEKHWSDYDKLKEWYDTILRYLV